MTELVHNAAIGLSFTLRNFRDDPVVFFGRPELNPLMLEFENNTGDYISAPGATIKLSMLRVTSVSGINAGVMAHCATLLSGTMVQST